MNPRAGDFIGSRSGSPRRRCLYGAAGGLFLQSAQVLSTMLSRAERPTKNQRKYGCRGGPGEIRTHDLCLRRKEGRTRRLGCAPIISAAFPGDKRPKAFCASATDDPAQYQSTATECTRGGLAGPLQYKIASTASRPVEVARATIWSVLSSSCCAPCRAGYGRWWRYGGGVAFIPS